MANSVVHRQSPKESGVVLITSLIFLVILTLIVLAVLRSGSLEERMAANARNRQLALQAAEAVVREGEDWLLAKTAGALAAAPFSPFVASAFTAACTNGLCGYAPGKWKEIDWSSAEVTRTFALKSSTLDASLVASQPAYIVEVVKAPGKIYGPKATMPCQRPLYRVTGRGVGQDGSEVFIQTIVRALPPDNC